MKRFIMILTTVLLVVFSISINAQTQSFTRKGDNFEQVSVKSISQSAIKTKFTWTDTKGKTYPIYITKTGRCFINKVSSKTGKEYKYSLKEDLAKTICKELNITYQEKK